MPSGDPQDDCLYQIPGFARLEKYLNIVGFLKKFLKI